MAKTYQNYFDIAHMIEEAEREHIAFVIAVSEDKERGAGKTYSSARYLYEKFLNEKERVVVFVREVKELGHIAEGIFGCYLADNYPNVNVYEKKQDNVFSYIYTKETNPEDPKNPFIECVGYVVPLKNAKTIKEFRGIFQSANVRRFYMDEFMPIDGKYLKDETDLMKTIIDTVNGRVEDLSIIMTANCISLGNPYFTMLHLNNKIQSNTRRIKTDVCVYENVVVEGLAEKHINSSINRAFGKTTDKYISNVWIGDNNSLVCKPDSWGHGRYVCTLIYRDNSFGVLKYDSVGLWYITRRIEKNCEYVYNVTLDGDLNLPLLKTAFIMKDLRERFFQGVVRCSDGGVQRMLMDVFGG